MQKICLILFSFFVAESICQTDSSCGNIGTFRPTPDTTYYDTLTHGYPRPKDTRTWEQKLKAVMDFDSPGLILSPSDLDTSRFKLALNLSLYFSKAASKKLVRDFFNDHNSVNEKKLNSIKKLVSIKIDSLILEWLPELKSMIYEGPLPVSSFSNVSVTKKFEGIIKLDQLKLGGPRMSIYLEDTGNNWCYFEYFKGTLKFMCSDTNINNIIAAEPRRKRLLNKQNRAPYQFALANEPLVRNFKTKFLRRPRKWTG